MKTKIKIIIISGPTSVGKTSLAILLASKFNGELISADSRQIYIGLDYGTNKFSADFANWHFEKRQRLWLYKKIPVHLYDLIYPDQTFSVFEYVLLANKKIQEISTRQKLPIIVGGTGFYQKGLISPFETIGIPADNTLRGQLEKLSTDKLIEKLKKLDPKKALKTDLKNPRRLIRAIEILSFKGNQKQIDRLPLDVLWIGLYAPGEILYQKADNWVETNLDKIIAETAKIIKSGYGSSIPMQGLIYKSTISYLDNQISLEKLKINLKSELHNYIKSQLTWFKKEKQITWFDITESKYPLNVVNQIEKWLNKNNQNAKQN